MFKEELALAATMDKKLLEVKNTPECRVVGVAAEPVLVKDCPGVMCAVFATASMDKKLLKARPQPDTRNPKL